METEININGQTWTSVVEQPNEEDWHSWETQLSSRSTLSIYGHLIDGVGELQGKQTIWSPSDDSRRSIAMGFMDADTLEGAMRELTDKVRKPVKDVALSADLSGLAQENNDAINTN